MRRQRLSRSHLRLLIAPLTFLVFSASLTWTQEGPSTSKTPTQLSNLAAQFMAVPEAKRGFHPAYENFSLTFALTAGQAPSQGRFRLPDIGYHPSLNRNNALPEPWQLAKTNGLQTKANHLIGNTPTEWLIDAITRDKAHYRGPGGDLQYYGHRIPWAGRIILSIGEKAKYHPRITRVLELIEPGLSGENPSPSGGSAGNIHVVGRGPFR
jgi:hypothetical protein